MVIVDESDVYFIDEDTNGGSIILDILVADWYSQLNGEVVDDYSVIIEHELLTVPYTLSPTEMMPAETGDNYFTYEVEISADNLTGSGEHRGWILIEYSEADYSNSFGVENDIQDQNLTAYFPFTVEVADTLPMVITVNSPNGGEIWTPGTPRDITWTSSNLSGDVNIEYSKDDFVSDINVIAEDEEDDGTYTWASVPNDISDTVKVRVSSVLFSNVDDESDDYFSILEESGWARQWGDSQTQIGQGISVGPDGSTYVTGYTDDPPLTDVFLNKYDADGNLEWELEWGAALYSDQGVAVAADDFGNVYVTGFFRDTVDFNPGVLTAFRDSNGENDVFVSKFDGDGIFQWVETFGGTESEVGYAVDTDSQGNVYLTGFFRGTVDFDPGGPSYIRSSSDDSADVYLTKLEPNGDFDWARIFEGIEEDFGHGVAVDGSDNVLVTGRFGGTVEFDPEGAGLELNSNGLADVFVVSYQPDNMFRWARSFGGAMDDIGNAIAAGSDGTSYITGSFNGSVDFDPGAGSDPMNANGAVPDIFINVLDSNGDYVRSQSFGTDDRDDGLGIAVDDLGNTYFTGYLDAGNPVFILNDAYVAKYDPDGFLQWEYYYDGGSTERGFAVATGPAGTAHFTGYFQNTVDFAPTGSPCFEGPVEYSSFGGADVYVVKYLPDGCW